MSTVAASDRAALARGSALSFAGSAASAVLGLALVVLLGRLLGDVGAGIVLQVIALFTIALGFARWGADSAALWILPRLADGERGAIRPALAHLIAVAGLGGAVGAVALTLGAALLDGPVAAALPAAAWCLPLAAMMLTALAGERALGGVGPYVAIGGVGLPALRPAAVALAVAAGGGVVAASLAWAAPAALALAAALLVLRRRVDALGVEPMTASAFRASGLPRRLRRYALPRVVSEFLSQLLIWLDVLIVGAIAGPAAAGVYGAATRIASAGSLVDSAIRVVVSPVFSRLLHRRDHTALADLFRAATTWLVLFSAPLYLLLAVFSPLALSLLGPSFEEGAVALAALCLGSVVTFLAGSVHSVLLMSGRSGLAAANKAIAVTADVALLLVLVPLWGVTGAAVAWAAACLLDAILATIQVHRVLALPLPLAAGVRPLLIALSTVGAAALGARLLLGATWLGLAVAAVLGGGALLTWARLAPRSLHLDAFADLARIRRSTTGDPS
ncbi:hypothetical protein GCM10017576_31480 [Microbacterium barkeri]|uniref:O-antigen/teichoic acid export membrane protein n=1 Tax=Microbacterium barkeri TaxID=33917 RepID=A0A9W6H5H4_9MICO|nr:polysaccharide biosynthesis C-terminal domain-containing protein [Microbacterium barkeri]MDR6878030.1 O-antigen/teichoic acid export membrane protein [Microbacterium barkeri]GLJ63017.1 hypothetical protein GCM10017576_31480 [Microbacterium barkeri]